MAATILIADDSPNIRDILKLSLEASGYRVLVAEDGEQALDLFGRERPDLLVVDVMMPKVNGFQICRRVKNNVATHATPVILLTAKTQQEDIFWGRDCGADDYITKPFSTRDLEHSVERLLQVHGAGATTGTAASVSEEVRHRTERGDPCQIVRLDWDVQAMSVFRKKYGEIKFHEMRDALCREAARRLAEMKDPGPVEVHEGAGLQLVLRGTGRQPLRRAQDLVRRLNTVAATFYAPDDRDRGYILLRDPHQRQERKLPLLTLKARLAAGQAA